MDEEEQLGRRCPMIAGGNSSRCSQGRLDPSIPRYVGRVASSCVERANPIERFAHGSGDLLALVLFADVRWLTLAWSKVLIIYEHCLVYSDGHTGHIYGTSALGGAGRAIGVPRVAPYELISAAAAYLDAGQLATEHKRNWLVWPDEVEDWSVRRGLIASRLKLHLADGSRRKVLWTQYNGTNDYAAIEKALTTCLGSR